jgi:hypothetical protein
MYAERLILETDQSGTLKHVPKLPPNKQLEIIFLVLDDAQGGQLLRRRPHPDIAGKTRMLGDIISSVAETDWDLPK